jgi:hypothetical protein
MPTLGDDAGLNLDGAVDSPGALLEESMVMRPIGDAVFADLDHDPYGTDIRAGHAVCMPLQGAYFWPPAPACSTS